MKRWRRIAMPALLLSIGIYLLIGCIPIPATRQYQPDNTLRPEHLVGRGKPIELGKTGIVDAFVLLSRQVKDAPVDYPNLDDRNLARWSISSNHHRFAICYEVRTLTWIIPLCFQIEPESELRWLVLDVNDVGIVTRSETTAQRPRDLDGSAEVDWFELFDATSRARLRAAGVFPDDDDLRALMMAAKRNPRFGLRPTFHPVPEP
jgi:hypothetical protein